MNRVTALLRPISLFSLLLLVTLNSKVASGQDNPPNFLFIITDDQSFETLGHLKQLDIETPNLDRLARRGCRRCPVSGYGGEARAHFASL